MRVEFLLNVGRLVLQDALDLEDVPADLAGVRAIAEETIPE